MHTAVHTPEKPMATIWHTSVPLSNAIVAIGFYGVCTALCTIDRPSLSCYMIVNKTMFWKHFTLICVKNRRVLEHRMFQIRVIYVYILVRCFLKQFASSISQCPESKSTRSVPGTKVSPLSRRQRASSTMSCL